MDTNGWFVTSADNGSYIRNLGNESVWVGYEMVEGIFEYRGTLC